MLIEWQYNQRFSIVRSGNNNLLQCGRRKFRQAIDHENETLVIDMHIKSFFPISLNKLKCNFSKRRKSDVEKSVERRGGPVSIL